MFSEDIEQFGQYFFPHHLSLNTPEFHKEIFDLYESDKTRIAIAAPRGHAKSTITDLVFLAWCICNKKVHFVLLCSDTYSQATLFLETVKAEFESNDKLKDFYGIMVSPKWSEGEIIANGIMIKAIGAGMKVRGLKYLENRPDLILVDDLENDELVENKDRREKLERWFNGALIPCMSKDGRAIIIGTILHYDSLLSKMISIDKYTEYSKKVYKAITEGKALWPEHLSIDELNQIKADYQSKGHGFLFYQEYQNDPISDENRKFKIEKFKYFTDEESNDLNLRNYIAIDRAYSKEKSADSTGITVVGIDQLNNWYVRQAERFKGTEHELISKIFDLKDYYKPVKIGIEQKAFEYTIKPTLDGEMRRRNEFFIVEELKDLGRNKNIRIEGLIPRFESGSIFLKKDQIDLIDELVRFPKAAHDDLSDSLSYHLDLSKNVNRPAIQQHIPKGLGHYNRVYKPGVQ